MKQTQVHQPFIKHGTLVQLPEAANVRCILGRDITDHDYRDVYPAQPFTPAITPSLIGSGKLRRRWFAAS